MEVLRSTSPARFQSLLSMLGFRDGMFHFSHHKIRVDEFHRGWFFIKFPTARIANQARACLEGLNFRGRVLVTKGCRDADESIENQPDVKPLSPTLAQLLELPTSSRNFRPTYVSHSTQTSRDKEIVDLKENKRCRDRAQVVQLVDLKDNREAIYNEQHGNKVDQKEAFSPTEKLDTEEDLISFDSP